MKKVLKIEDLGVDIFDREGWNTVEATIREINDKGIVFKVKGGHNLIIPWSGMSMRLTVETKANSLDKYEVKEKK
jgi:hypothetical protein